jgi:regulatory protein
LADAYLDGLRLLARRELSAAQLRTRLARRAHSDADVDEALGRLRAEGALDESRTAAAIAGTAVRVGRLGPRRVRRAVEAAGIPADVAERAVRDALDGVDATATVAAALDRALRAHRGAIDERTAARVYRRLVAHGHEPDVVARAINGRRRTPSDE